MSAILEMKNVSRIYRNGRGLQTMDLTLGKGEILGLLGANGSGKTTLLKIASGLMRPDAGSISIAGADPYANPARALRRVGAIIETPALYLHLSCEENLKIACMYHQISAKKNAERMMELFSLTDFRREAVKKFSLGMKQRLAVAIQFLGNKKLLLLDEPTNGLDIENAVIVKNAIRQACHETGAAAIISSHLSADLERIATRVRILKDGRTVKDTPIENALSEKQTLEDFYMSAVKEESA
ncbi:MAG: ABC transporter ATP-binding protein [Clostridia bacterium]|nr:ABC transporter ATP-binding protein [Clostridia bacterium]